MKICLWIWGKFRGPSVLVFSRNCSNTWVAFELLVEIVPSHEWHLNFSPKLHQWRLSNGLEAIAEGHLRVWTDAIWGEKFKCHECTEQFLINTIKYWQNPFHLEEGKSQTSQVWKNSSQFDRREISNITGFEKINLFYAFWLKNICPLLLN